ncbi:MAG: hypothetical protein Q4B45_09530 [Coriobacteriia bacterium]|nr:hypothetical protein [Coriobacteriia bacterium]
MPSSSLQGTGPQAGNGAQVKAGAGRSNGTGAAGGNAALSAEEKANGEFIRAENEDDDGYDPYSDRRPAPEPLFERDPWG